MAGSFPYRILGGVLVLGAALLAARRVQDDGRRNDVSVPSPVIPPSRAERVSSPASGPVAESGQGAAPADSSFSVRDVWKHSGSGTTAVAPVPPKVQRVTARGSVPSSHRPAGSAFAAVDPLAPGNFLPAPGGAILVHAYRHRDGSATPELDLRTAPFTPSVAKPASSDSSSRGQSESDLPLHSNDPAVPADSSPRYGLTYEQELFRTKWGWSAFDQAQRKGAQLEAEQ